MPNGLPPAEKPREAAVAGVACPGQLNTVAANEETTKARTRALADMGEHGMRYAHTTADNRTGTSSP